MNYSDNVADILRYSHEEAERLGNNYIGPNTYFWQLFVQERVKLLTYFCHLT